MNPPEYLYIYYFFYYRKMAKTIKYFLLLINNIYYYKKVNYFILINKKSEFQLNKYGNSLLYKKNSKKLFSNLCVHLKNHAKFVFFFDNMLS